MIDVKAEATRLWLNVYGQDETPVRQIAIKAIEALCSRVRAEEEAIAAALFNALDSVPNRGNYGNDSFMFFKRLGDWQREIKKPALEAYRASKAKGEA